MCEYVFIPKAVEEEMKKIYPSNFPEEYYHAFKSMTKAQIEETKKQHRIEKMKIKGKEGKHEIIFGTIDDAQAVLPMFVGSFSCLI